MLRVLQEVLSTAIWRSLLKIIAAIEIANIRKDKTKKLPTNTLIQHTL